MLRQLTHAIMVVAYTTKLCSGLHRPRPLVDGRLPRRAEKTRSKGGGVHLAKRKMRLSWFLIKKGLEDDITAVIEKPKGGALQGFKVSALSKDRDSLFIKPSHPSPPRWRDYVEPHVDGGGLPQLFGASSSGVLLVPASGRLLAISFGYGRHLVRSEAVVQDFGLKVVLNEIDPELIKSVDARTFDELTINTRQGAIHHSGPSPSTIPVTSYVRSPDARPTAGSAPSAARPPWR
jgi:Family of unknown function (DUF6119)